jgi:hypothetical protein
MLALATCSFAQTATPSAPCVTAIPYNYLAEAGITYGALPQYTTGFGVRIGCSSAFTLIDFDSTIGQPFTSYSTGRVSLKYIVATKGFWSMSSFAGVGATTNGSVSFAGGGALSVDLGSFLSKGKVSLIVEGQFRATAVPGNTSGQVAKSAGVMVLKTF